MSKFKTFIIKLLREEEGASALEYALLAAMVAVVIATFVTPVGTAIKAVFQSVLDAFTAPGGGG